MLADTALFFGLWLRKPLQIAAICPSGAPVAAAIARLIDPAWPGPVLELGAGTGTITRRLLAAGWAPGRIIACERESQLLEILRRAAGRSGGADRAPADRGQSADGGAAVDRR